MLWSRRRQMEYAKDGGDRLGGLTRVKKKRKRKKIQWLSHGTRPESATDKQASSKVSKCSAVLTADSSGVAQRLKKGG